MKYVCTGRVRPERADIHFERIEMGISGGGRVVASCDASQITVTIDNAEIDGWIAAQIQAQDIGSMIVSALGFALGCGYSVEIIQVTEEDGTPHVFGVQPKGDAHPHLGWDPHMPQTNRVLQLSGHDVFFRLAVRDYLRAMTETTECAAYCFRAIEGIKSAFVFKTGKDRWDDMHAALGTDRATITDTVKNFADAVRHGNWIQTRRTNRTQRWEMLRVTRDILTKYLDHALVAEAVPEMPNESPSGLAT